MDGRYRAIHITSAVVLCIIWPIFADAVTSCKHPRIKLTPSKPCHPEPSSETRRLQPGQRSIRTFHRAPAATYKCCVTASARTQSGLCRRIPFIFGRLGNLRRSPVWALQMTRMPHVPSPEALFISMYYSSLCVCVLANLAGHSRRSCLHGRGWWRPRTPSETRLRGEVKVVGSEGVAERSQRSDSTVVSRLNICSKSPVVPRRSTSAARCNVRTEGDLCSGLRSRVWGQTRRDEA